MANPSHVRFSGIANLISFRPFLRLQPRVIREQEGEVHVPAIRLTGDAIGRCHRKRKILTWV